jgi:hypothetical protein
MVDSTYIPAYIYKFKAIYIGFPMNIDRKRVDTADIAYKEKRAREWEEANAVFKKAWAIDSQYFPIYEFKLMLDYYRHINTALYHKLNGKMKYTKDLKYNTVDRQCRPYDNYLKLHRAEIFFDLGIYDSALVWADDAYPCWPDSVLKLKRNIFIKINNKHGIKHIENDLKSLYWQTDYLWINKVEDDILKASDDCCISIYCYAIEHYTKTSQFKDLKLRCKKIMHKYHYLKPFYYKNCIGKEGNCIHFQDYL